MVAGDAVLARGLSDWRGEALVPVAGIVDVLDSYAFVRTSGYLPGPNDVYVSMGQVKKYGLRKGDAVHGSIRAPREGERRNQRQKFVPLQSIDSINGMSVEESMGRPQFNKLTPLYPQERLKQETTPNKLTGRLIDIVAPIGKGQRALIVSPPKAGKTTILQDIANAITKNNPECHLMVVLVDERPEEVKRQVNYYKGIDDLNARRVLPHRLLITNNEASLSEEQVKQHFASIDEQTAAIVKESGNVLHYYARALDFYLVQDFASSIDDFTQSILLDDTFFPAYFMRALVRYKQLEYKKAEAGMNEGAVSGAQEVKKAEVTAMDYDIVKNDLDHVIQLAPDFVYGYYNRGNVLSLLKDYRAALADYDKAIGLNPDFAEAYFNRGLTHIFLGNNRQGISDLSKAGELGIVSAYNIIKRFTNTQQ